MATKIVFTPYWELRLEGVTDEKVGEVADAVQGDAGRFAPKRSGLLSRSFGVVKPRDLVRWVGSSLWRWRFSEKGTAAHEIRAGDRARSARRRPMRSALIWPGILHPVRRVRHPGGPATHHLKRALYRKRAI